MTRSAMVTSAPFEPNVATGHDLAGAPRTPFNARVMDTLRARLGGERRRVEQARVSDAEGALKAAESRFPVLPNFLVPNAASSLVTSATDYGRFIRHLVTARPGSDAAAIMQQMITAVVERSARIGWGLGLGTETISGRTVGWQWGDNPGFKNFCAFDPGARGGLVIFTNGDRGARLYERVVRSVTGVDHPAFLFT
jgi:hypothetical protein